MMKLVFNVNHFGDEGLNPYSDQITVKVESGDPGGDPGEFAEEMKGFLAEWFDGARVELIEAQLEG